MLIGIGMLTCHVDGRGYVGMLTCHVDGRGYVEKHFFGCAARKLEQKIKFRPPTLRI